MTAKELQEKMMELQRECNEKQDALRKQYAIEHNPVKVGDVVTDHYHTIRVERMGVYGHPVPFMRYHGTELTKQGEPFDDEIEEVYLMGAFENGDYKAINPYPRNAGDFPETMVLHNYDMPPAPPVRKQKFCGPCCDRCQHRFGTTSNRDWCSSHYENDKCYRFKLEKQ